MNPGEKQELKSVLNEMGIHSVLITCHTMKIYSGSEMVTLDIAKAFKDQGVDTVCVGLVTGDPAEKLFLSNGIPVYNLIDTPRSVSKKQFDLVWSHHWPVVGYCLGELRVQYRYFVTSSLSAFEPLEIISLTAQIADALVFNSQSTKVAHIAETPEADESKMHVMKNSLGEEWFQPGRETKKGGGLRSLAVISNHVPSEVQLAINILIESGLEVTRIGTETKQQLVDLQLIQSYDAVITIGHTVQKCLATGVPVYCYDRFGGPGWINKRNLEEAEFHNFSGRCCKRKLATGSIVHEVMQGYSEAFCAVNELQRVAVERYRLVENLSSIVQTFKPTRTYHKLAPANNTLRKLSQIYLREKFNINIPALVNNLDFAEEILHVSFQLVDKKEWGLHFAYVGISSLPPQYYSGLTSLEIGGVALSKQSENAVARIVIVKEGLEIATAQLHRPSPGIGLNFSTIKNSENAGFTISLENMLAAGDYSLVVILANAEEIQVGQLFLRE